MVYTKNRKLKKMKVNELQELILLKLINLKIRSKYEKHKEDIQDIKLTPIHTKVLEEDRKYILGR